MPHVGSAGGEHHRSPRSPRCRPSAGCRRSTRHEVGPLSGLRSAPRPRTPTKRARSPFPRASRSDAAQCPRRSRGESLVELDRAHLLERVDHRMAVGAERQPSTGLDQLLRRRRCRRRGRARWSGRSRRSAAAAPSTSAVVVGEVRGVHRREPLGRARRAPPAAATGVMPYAAWHASFSATCSDTWTCSGAVRQRRRRPSSGRRAGRPGPSGWPLRRRRPSRERPSDSTSP